MLFITYLTIGLLKYLLHLPRFLQNTENLMPWILAFPQVLLFLFVWRIYKSDRISSPLVFTRPVNHIYLLVVISSIALNLFVYVIYQTILLDEPIFGSSYLQDLMLTLIYNIIGVFGLIGSFLLYKKASS